MTAHVSYIGLLKAQAKPHIGKIARPNLTVEEMLAGTRAARKALGLGQSRGTVRTELLRRDVPEEVIPEIAALVLPDPPAPAEPPPVIIVVQQHDLYEEDDRAPLIPLPRWKSIVREVSKKHGISIPDILSARRSVPVVRARHEVMYRLSTETTLSYPQIGKRLGGKDHTTVIHGAQRHRERMEAGQI